MRAMFEVYEHPTCRRCGHAWETDPAIAVPCPVCSTPAGRPCPPPKRPSGHAAWGDWAHDPRDLAADAAHAYDHPCAKVTARNHPTGATPMTYEQAIALAIDALEQEISRLQIDADLYNIYSTDTPRPGELLAEDYRTPWREAASKRRAACRIAIDRLRQPPRPDQLSLFDAPPPPPGGTPSDTPIAPSEPPSRHLGPITRAQFDALAKTYSADKLSSDQRHPTVRGMVAIAGQLFVCTGRGWGKSTDLPEDITITRVARAATYAVPPRGAHGYHGKTFTYHGDQWFCYGPTTHVKCPAE